MPGRRAVVLLLATLAAGCAGTRGAGGAATGSAPTVPFVYVSGYSGPIEIFRLDVAAGSLTPVGAAAGGEQPSFLAFGPGGRTVYAVNEVPAGRVLAFAVDPATGGLRRLNDSSSMGVGPAHLSVDPSGRFVLVANYAHESAGTIAVLPIRADGSLGAAIDTEDFGHATNPHFVTADPAGRFVMVPCKGGNFVAQLRFEAASGLLGRNDPDRVHAPAGAAPRHLAFHPGGRFAYVINERGSTMTAYRYHPEAGRLEELQTASTLPEGWSGRNSGAHVVVHPSGRFLYGSNRGHDSIVIFALDAETGRMTLVGHETRTIKVPRSFAVDPGGALLLVASQAAGTLTVFRISGADGTLTPVGRPLAVSPRPSFVGVLSLPGR